LKENLITESNFRQYLKCQRLFSYEPNFAEKIELQIFRDLFERCASLYLKNSAYSMSSNVYNETVVILNRYNKTEQYLESQYEKLLNTLIINSTELISKFNINSYYPITGPLYYNHTIDKLTIKIKISGIFRNKNQSLNIVLFSPHKNELNILNDPINHFINNNFNKLIATHHKRPNVIFHIFYYDKDELKHIKHIFKSNKINYNSISKQYISDFYNPVVPCNYNCKYKNKCMSKNYEL
jgi:hypothetical protein